MIRRVLRQLTTLATLVSGLVVARVAKAAPEWIFHSGMSSASAAVAVGTNQFLAGSDEDNRLRLYTVAAGGPVIELDVSPWLRLVSRHGEVDLEGAATVGDRTYWLGSHSRAKDGRERPDRARLFATQLATNENRPQLRFVGHPYTGLIEALAAAPLLARFHLAEAVRRVPGDGGLNIEGLAAGPRGELWLGFRSPVPEGKALLVPLTNPEAVIQGGAAQLGEPVLLDLGGRGVRDIVWSGAEWFVIGGGVTGGGSSRLYRWRPGTVDTERVDHPGFKRANPEALAFFGTTAAPRLLVLSDDGKLSRSRFRSFWVIP